VQRSRHNHAVRQVVLSASSLERANQPRNAACSGSRLPRTIVADSARAHQRDRDPSNSSRRNGRLHRRPQASGDARERAHHARHKSREASPA
jgi:hypothetical protein